MNNAEMKLELFKEEDFLGTKCNFYKDENNSTYMTRKQIGEALQYKDSDDAMYRLHDRNRERLDKFSVTVKLSSTDNKQYETMLYMERGIYEICRFSKQPIANDFYDWVYEKLETYRRTSGVVQLGEEKQFLDNYFPTLTEETKIMMVKDLNESIKNQQDKIKELQMQTQEWNVFMNKDGYTTMSKVAKSINMDGVGRNTLFKILRENKVLMRNNEPYQSYINRGYFKVVVGIGNKYPSTSTMVTPKGMNFVSKSLRNWGYLI